MEPMTIIGIGSAVASGLSSIFGGKAAAAAAQQRNEQAYRNWIQSNTNKTFANAREQFQAAYNFAQQQKRNSAIAEAAYRTQFDATRSLRDITTFQQMQLSKQQTQAASSLINALTNRGISSSSGLYGALATAQTLDALNNSKQLQKNYEIELSNIDKQFIAQMSQQTENIFMPNIQGYDQAPIFEDASAAETGGLISGLVQIGGAIGAAGFSGFGGTPGMSTPNTYDGLNTNQSGGDVNGGYHPSGGAVGGR